MEYINYLATNGLVWDDKYLDIVFNEDEYKNNFEVIKNLLISIVSGLGKNSIQTEFHKLLKIILTYHESICKCNNLDIDTLMCIDIYKPFDEIKQKNYKYPIQHSLYNINTVYEYFIVSRALIKYGIEECIPIMDKIDLNNTEITKYYNIVNDLILDKIGKGWNTKSARNR